MAVKLPDTIGIGPLLSSRVKEISSLSRALTTEKRKGKIAGQQVPRHMRRRAVAHDVRRLPRKWRDRYMREKEAGGGDIPASKRPSRKHRRRPSNLLKEYNRRQRNQFWLETHIWHAKRFHMYHKWGYKIPGFPNDKCWRANYRAAKSSCLMFDISYFNTIEIKGPKSVILEELSKITRPETGKVFSTTSSNLEQSAVLYLPRTADCVNKDSSENPQNADKESTEKEADNDPMEDSDTAESRLIESDVNKESADSHMPIDSKSAENEASEASKENLPNKDTEPSENLPTADDKSANDNQLIGEVSYMWLSDIENTEEENATLWLNCHPAFIKDIWQALSHVFEFESAFDEKIDDASEMEHEDDEVHEPPAKKQKLCHDDKENNKEQSKDTSTKDKKKKGKVKKNIEKEKLAPRNVPIERAPKYACKNGVSITDLQGVINRFRLVGPKKVEILKTSCVPTSLKMKADKAKKKGPWWAKLAQTEDYEAENSEQNERFEQENLDSNFSLIVRDPRLLLPVKKYMKPAEDNKGDTAKSEKVPLTSENELWRKSPFFDHSVRDIVTQSKLPDIAINDRRSKAPIPGISIPVDDRESRVPVVILPDSARDSIDLLVPAGWSMPFWMCLVYNGCRVGGEKQFNHLHLEQGRPPLLYRYPESPAGQQEAATLKQDLQKEYFAHPPNHRVNFPRLGIVSPFQPPWKTLIKDWAVEDENENTKIMPKSCPEDFTILRDASVLEGLKQSDDSVYQTLDNQDTLVAVRLKIALRGRLGANTLICLPTKEDIEEVVHSGIWEGPVEIQQQDQTEKERKDVTEMHKNMKKRLKRRWKKLKDKKVLMQCQATALGKELDTEKMNHVTDGLNTLKQMRNAENANFGAKSEELWIGGECAVKTAGVRHSCKQREVMGFVTQGDMSYKAGCFVGYGFVALKAIKKWTQMHRENPQSLVLTRETTSLQYRFSHMELIL
eukprot:TRINITY_DN5295_c0_g1_i12.p1 TRINITY_DN5295_c0_g1~~TRINITY_DN5295_c0_g1_i12.p1  ORF type:complete len:959 (+),score=235.08 TRINITY_DN5295_c0_g1_i12:40-2916(+)